MNTTPVLIVGAGPIGLTASLLFSRYGVPSTLVERRRDVDPHPRARSISRRTMEIFRGFGLVERLTAAALPAEWTQEIVYATTLTGPEIGRVRSLDFESAMLPDVSPSMPLMSSQDRMEPVLRELAAAASCAEVRFGSEVREMTQDDGGVTAVVRDLDSGAEDSVEARYVIAADGAGSRIRQRLGIDLHGPQGIMTLADVHFTADLDAYVRDRHALLYFVDAPGGTGVFQPLDGGRCWRCQIILAPDMGAAEDCTTEMAATWIRSAVGDAAVTPNILSVRPWTMHSAQAERFRHGRIFMAGDAAHILPPSGGLGMNTGVQGIFNLAWKMAAVLQGWGGPELLDTYEVEHRPIAMRNSAASVANSVAVGEINGAYRSGGDVAAALARAQRYGNYMGLDLGMVYESGAVVPDGSEPPPIEDAIRFYTPTGRPGHRAPHVQLERDGAAVSTLDLFIDGCCLLAGADASPWVDAARQLAAEFAMPLTAYQVGPDGALQDPSGTWAQLYGVSPDGAVLVRPDGFVAWRSATAVPDPQAVLADALTQILCRTTPNVHTTLNKGDHEHAEA